MLVTVRCMHRGATTVTCFAPEEVAHVSSVPLGLSRVWVSLSSSPLSAQAAPKVLGI